MTTTLVKRPARVAPPSVPTDQVEIAEPPTQQQAPPAAAGVTMIIMPVMGGVGSLTMAMANRGSNPLIAIGALAALVGSICIGVVMILSQKMGPKRLLRESRERYLDYIEELRHSLRATISAQRQSSAWRHPAPGMLPDIARSQARRWERRRTDPDHLVVRIGVGDQPIAAALTMTADTGPLNQFDPVCLDAAKTLRARYSVLHDEPVTLDLGALGAVSVLGDRYAARHLATAAALQLVTFHSPDDVKLAVVRADTEADAWDWAKWLPHCQAATMDGDVPARLVANSVAGMAELLQGDLERRLDERARSRGRAPDPRDRLIVVVDGAGLPGARGLSSPDPQVSLADLGVHVIMLLGDRREEPETVDERLEIRADLGAVQASRPAPFVVDRVPDGLPRLLARQLSPLRLALEDRSGHDSMAATVGLPEILGVEDPATLDARATWRKRSLRDLLRVPIGVGSNGGVVLLDLKESAHGGMGPHGMVVGATGSGKSEMLRTLVSSLVINHGPDRLALMLVDFKGGATFAAMDDIPHLAGIITNLQDDLTLVDRMRDALYGEMQRRQQLLKQAGNLPNVTAYQELIDNGEQLEPLPHLLVIIDEFSELLTAKPDFAELFVAIGRIGRSIGVHLLLATQKLEMGKIRGLESHLSYRISLRTFSESESRDAIGVPDAYHLPPEPGAGYLKVDTTVFERFKAALVSSPYTPPTAGPRTEVPAVPYLAVNGVGAWIARLNAEAQAEAAAAESRLGGGPSEAERSVLDVVCERLTAPGVAPARPVWLDPLPASLPLDAVLDPDETAQPATVTAVLGLVDEPAKQRQYPLEWDFTGAAGNLMVVGAPQSGKSMLLRTMVGSLGLRYAPGDVAFYCLDFGGGTLRGFAAAPHVATVTARTDPERIGRTVNDVLTQLEGREELFRLHGVSSIEEFRRGKAAGWIETRAPGDVFLVIDGWGSFREEYDGLDYTVADIAARGLNYGVHVVITVNQSMDVRMRMQPAFGGRIELRLNDAFDSSYGRAVSEQVAKDAPGRGVVAPGLLFHGALPRIDSRSDDENLSGAQDDLVAALVAKWPDRAVARVQVLPELVGRDELPPVDPSYGDVPVGVLDRNLRAVSVDLIHGSSPHLLVLGDGETGKTNLLKLLLKGYLELKPPEELGIVLVDNRRTLLDVVPPEYLLAYCTDNEQTQAVSAEIAGSLRARLPGKDVTSEQLRNRSWWKGLEVLFVVDDYDLVSTSSGNPLSPLIDYFAQGSDLGFHFVLSRRMGGFARAQFEPMVQRLTDLSVPAFVFSGDRMEGRVIGGVTATRLPVGRALYANRNGLVGQVQTAFDES